MTDIAPLGFAVDTGQLEKGKTAAKAAATEIGKLADTADEVGEAFDRAKKPTQDAGKAIETAGKAAVTTKRATDDLNKAQRESATATTATGKATEQVAKITEAAARAAADYMKAMHGTTTAVTATGNAVASMSGKMTATTQAAMAAGKALANVTVTYGTVASAAGKAKDKIEDSGDALDDLGENAESATGILHKLWAAMGIGRGLMSTMGQVAGQAGLSMGSSPGGLATMASMARTAVTGLGAALGPVGIAVLAVAAAVLVAVAVFAKIVTVTAQAQDKMAAFEARLKTALGSQQAATASMKALGDMADDVGVSMETTIDSFARLAQNSKALGATRAEMLQFVETVQKLGAATGTSSFDIEGAMVQLGQSLASGKLNGDELRSIMERMPALADAIAKGMGKTTGELRAMGAEGKLTSEKVFAAILSQTEKARKDFETMPDSVDKATKRMENSISRLYAHIGEKIGASEIARGIINGIAGAYNWLDSFIAEREGTQTDSQKATEEAAAKRNKAMADLARSASAASEGYSQERNKVKQRQDDIKLYQDQLIKARVLHQELERQAIASAAKEAAAFAMLAQGRAMIASGTASGNTTMVGLGTDLMKTAAGDLGGRDANGRIISDGSGNGLINQRKGARGEANTVAAQIKTLTLGLQDAMKAQSDYEKKEAKKDAGTASAYQNLLKSNAELRKALESSEGGAIDIRQQAYGLEGAKTTAAAVAAVVEQRSLEARKSISTMEGAAASATRLATALRDQGHASIELEAQNEALTWKYTTFGDTLADNAEIVKQYTAALVKQKQAEQALADQRSIEKFSDDQFVRTAQRDAMGDGEYATREAEVRARAEIIKRNDPSRAAFADRQVKDFTDRENFEAERRIEQARRDAEQSDLEASATSTAQLRKFRLDRRVDDARRAAPDEQKGAAGDAVVDGEAAERRANVKATTLSMRDQVDALKDQYALAKLAGSEARVQNALMERRRALMNEGVDLASREAVEQLAVTEQLERQRIALEMHVERLDAMKGAWDELTDEIGGAMGEGFTKVFRDGEDAGREMFQALERASFDFVNKLMQKLAFDPLMDALSNIGSSFIGSLFGGQGVPRGTGLPTSTAVPNAYGGVYDKGSPIPFATGGVVTRPTTFPMSSGRTGLMGEAGEEGIFPLKRGSSGKLGLEVSGRMGSNVSIQIIDQRTGRDVEPVKVQERTGSGGQRQIEVMIRDTVKGSMRRGEFDTEMNSQYGVNRSVTRR